MINILLINTNPVVSRLITLCIKDEPSDLYEVSTLNEINKDLHYDIVFIDDALHHTILSDELEQFEPTKRILLSSQSIEKPSNIDEMIKKPFLPSKIIDAVKSIMPEETTDTESDTPAIFPIVEKDGENDLSDPSSSEQEEQINEILNLDEIEKIKSLLDMEEETPDEPLMDEEKKREVIKQNLIDEGLEIVEGEDVIHAIQSDFALDITHNVDKKRENFEKKLLDAIKKMKIKKIKKLLEGSKVTIDIRFKDEE